VKNRAVAVKAASRAGAGRTLAAFNFRVVAEHPGTGEPSPNRNRRPTPAVLALIRRPYVAEILAALDERPRTLAGLRRATGAPRRYAVAALRALAAHQAVSRTPATGTWDATAAHLAAAATRQRSPAERRIRYRLTPAGYALIDDLFHIEVWRAAYQPDPGDTTA
jgi:DNA-binding HxlR family transcriptional regulator